MYSFGQMVTMVLDEGRNTGDTGEMRNRVRRWLNEEVVQLATEFDFPGLVTKSEHLLDEPFGVTSAEFDILSRAPADLLKLIKVEILDPSESPPRLHRVEILSHNEFRRRFLRDSTTSTTRADKGSPNRPRFIAFEKLSGINTFGLTRPVQWVVTSTAAEAASTIAQLYGYGDVRHERFRSNTNLVALSTSTQNIGSSGEIDFPETFSKNEISVGDIALSDGTTIRAFIERGEFHSFVTSFMFHPFRDRADYRMFVTYKRLPRQMVPDADIPSGLPYEAWPIVLEGGLERILRFTRSPEWQNAAQRKAQLKAQLTTKLKEEQIDDAGFQWEQPFFMDSFDLIGR